MEPRTIQRLPAAMIPCPLQVVGEETCRGFSPLVQPSRRKKNNNSLNSSLQNTTCRLENVPKHSRLLRSTTQCMNFLASPTNWSVFFLCFSACLLPSSTQFVGVVLQRRLQKNGSIYQAKTPTYTHTHRTPGPGVSNLIAPKRGDSGCPFTTQLLWVCQSQCLDFTGASPPPPTPRNRRGLRCTWPRPSLGFGRPIEQFHDRAEHRSG